MKTKTMEWGKIAALAVAGILALGANATPSVTIDSVLQRWPWNNKVDITYTVTDGQDVTRGVFCKLVFNATIDGQTYEIDGVTNVGASASSGTHTVTWLPPSGIKTSNCSMTATLLSSDAPSGDDYMVIDLTSGMIAYEGLLASQEQSNARYNTATYKTTKMVLRKIPAGGTYPTGYSNETSNQPRTWTTDRDYYLGIFGVTQSQYMQLGFSNPVNDAAQLADSANAATDNDWAAHRPVTRMYYDLLRGSTTAPADALPVSNDPNSASYLQRLNLKTGNKFGFDLPTEIMYEIAARAGATTKYWWGQNPDSSKVVCSDNSTTTKAVGLYPANDWGLYDMAGNVATLCRDTRSKDGGARLLHEAADPWTPVGELADTQVHFRQACYLQAYNDYRMGASNRGGYISRNIANQMSGIRIAYIVK